MRDLRDKIVDRFRVRGPEVIATYGHEGGKTEGVFDIGSGVTMQGYRLAARLHVIAAAGDGWDHVSASCKHRVPSWNEMMLVHRLFFLPHEISVQFCFGSDEHVNLHPNTLHLWRPHGVEVPLPPRWMV